MIESPATSSAPNYLSALNAEQRQAVETTDGPLLVLAGAGTGKTRVLTTRIAHLLLTKKALPGQILAVTFTNKAAKEMVGRVERITGQNSTGNSAGLWLGTFHAISARILRRHAEFVGLTSQFTILDADDQHRLLKQIMEELHIDHKRFPGKVCLSLIQAWKDRALTPDKVSHQKESGYADGKLPELYKAYQKRLQTLNAADFGDLMLHCITLFSGAPEILEQYAQRFRYILVDEYQDTNVAQYLWLRLLAMAHKNLCCVGDDDQSIYSWRGAEVGNILKFEKDFPGAGIIRLEENYRSTPHILGAASGLIAHNEERLGKTLRTSLTEGEKIRVQSVWDDKEEARTIGEEIENNQRKGTSLDEMAVLVRAGFQTRSFEEQFISMAIPYRVIGGLRFYERKEIKDIIAYLRVTVQPHDDLALERIINVPKRGIGNMTVNTLSQQARAEDRSLHDIIGYQLQADSIKGKAKASLQWLVAQFNQWQRLLVAKPGWEPDPQAIVEKICEESGYVSMLKDDKSPEAPGRLENIRELVRAMSDFPSIPAFLEHVSLVAERDAAAGESEAMVTLMTLHASKGLEYDVVFLPGWEEGLFPHQRSLDESGTKGLEEERRLAYVGITRARKQSHIVHAANRRVYNQWQSCIPSRFLTEIPPEHIDLVEDPSRGNFQNKDTLQRQIDAILSDARGDNLDHSSSNNGRNYGGYSDGWNQNYKAEKAEERKRAKTRKSSDGSFKVGGDVTHASFGKGKIVAINETRLTIVFENAGIKKLMQEFVTRV